MYVLYFLLAILINNFIFYVKVLFLLFLLVGAGLATNLVKTVILMADSLKRHRKIMVYFV